MDTDQEETSAISPSKRLGKARRKPSEYRHASRLPLHSFPLRRSLNTSRTQTPAQLGSLLVADAAATGSFGSCPLFLRLKPRKKIN